MTIGDRDPWAFIGSMLPKTEDDVVCLSCRTPFTVERTIGVDPRRAACPTCGEMNAELEREAPQFTERLH